jgi:NAD(P)H dehydrogenase (quinone)
MERITMSLVITGAAGQLGRRTAELLLEQVDPSAVVLVTRRPAELADLAARGAQVRAGDFDDPSSLDTALHGGERLLLISTDALGRRVEQHRAAISAAARAGVRHVAYTSLPNPSAANPAAVADEHRATEDALRASGLAWTLVRNALYSEHRIGEAQAAVASGVLHHNQGDGRTAYVSREDCAAAAAAVLAGGTRHEGKVYDITGPELLGGDDLAALYGSVGGAPVQAVAVDDDAYVAGALAAGLPEPVAGLLASFGAAIRGGHLDQVSTTVADLTGRGPRPLREVLEGALVAA